MTYRPNAVVALTDPRLRGIQLTDLRATYGARLDGSSHPLSSVFSSLGGATSLSSGGFPNIGLTGGNWAAMELDTAAWLQAEYDLRAGSGGIIGLPDGSIMMLSGQLWLQNAAKVWFHGGRNAQIRTAGTGSTAAIRVSNGTDDALALFNLNLLATASRVSPSTTGGGAAHTGFRAGAVAFAIDNCQGVDFERMRWNGYDQPIAWGDNTYGINFRNFSATGCNAGINWAQTSGLNSAERIRFEGGALANNNYGFDFNLTYGSSSQGGGLTIEDSSIDYNIVRQGRYIGTASGGTYCGNALHLINNYIETTGACSGGSLCRIYSQGLLSMSENHCYENDSIVPPGFVEVADGMSCSMSNNPINGPVPALMYSATANPKFVSAIGNRMQNLAKRPIMLRDANGDLMQPDQDDGKILEIYNDVDPSLWPRYYGKTLTLFYYAGPGYFTVPNDAVFNFPIDACIPLKLSGQASGQAYPPQPVKIIGASGVTVDPYPGNTLATANSQAYLRKNGPNNWRVQGSNLTLT